MIYALDRIKNLRIADVPFHFPKNFDPQSYLEFSFGIIVEKECDIEKIQIKVYGNKSKYIRALPLHHSQREVEMTNDCSIFEYFLKPTYDFYQELLSHGDEIEVLAPVSLRKNMANTIQNICKLYKD